MQSKRVSEIVRLFGLDHCKEQEKIEVEIPEAVGGRIVLLNGPSGAGKSRLMGRMKREWMDPRRDKPVRWIDLAKVELPRRAVVDCFSRGTLEEALLGLNRVGLAEAWDYVREPAALSEGQKFRLKLAVGLARAKFEARRQKPEGLKVVACDEFCAILDRVTARVVARTLRRTISGREDVCAIVATSHDDLVEALRPDVVIRCDFGKAMVVSG